MPDFPRLKGFCLTVPVLALTKSTGGIALYHQALVAGLDARRFAIHTLCLSENAEEYANALRASGQTAETFAMARYKIDIMGDLRVMRRAVAAARQIGAKVVLCHGSKPGMIGRAVGWWLGIPTVYCQASLPFLTRVQGRKAPVYRVMERVARVFRGHIVCLTDGARRATLEHGLTPPDRVSVIKTGIDTQRFRPTGERAAVLAELGLDPAKPVVGWIGRFEPQKAPDVFIEAALRLLALHPTVQIVMAGEGRQKDQIAARVAASGQGARIHLLPWQTNPARLMQAFDIFTLSSRWEGLPLVLLETMALGCVPVSTHVDGCAEVVAPGQGGWLVPPDDPAALAAALAEALSDPVRLAAMSQKVRAHVAAHFDKTRMLDEWAALLTRLAGAA